MDLISRIRNITAQLVDIDGEVAVLTDNFTKKPLNEGAVLYFQLKEAYTELDTARKMMYKRLDYMNKAAIPEMLERMGIDKIQVPEIARSFYILTKSSASMIDKDAGFKWLRERGDGALITETVSAGTLSSYMKDLITNEGIDPPDDIFRFSTYNTTGMSKYTPK